MSEESSSPEPSLGLRPSDLRELRNILGHEIFHRRAVDRKTRGTAVPSQAIRLAELLAIEARLRNEIQWADATRIPWDRIRAEFPAVIEALSDLRILPDDWWSRYPGLHSHVKSLLARLEAARQPD